MKYLFPFLTLLTACSACAQSQAVMQADPALATLVAPDAEVTKVADDFKFTEGPLWSPRGTLLFSDIPADRVYEVDPKTGAREVFLEPSGASNGLAYDEQGRLLLCQHKARRVARLNDDSTQTVLADRWQGKRFNSPNDLVHHASGALFFTDPPWGLQGLDEDSEKEIPFNGVFRLGPDGAVTVVDSTLFRPNGIAVSPDGRWLYVGESSRDQKVYWKRYPLDAQGIAGAGERFAEADEPGNKGNADGLKVDQQGNMYATGPGGIWVFSSEGQHLGTLRFPELPANCAWGGSDSRTLYVTARQGIYAIPVKVPGLMP